MQGLANDGGLRPLLNTDERSFNQATRAQRRLAKPARPVHARLRRFRSAGAALDGVGGLGWSVFGFVAGAVFWHFVGFWGFLSEVVFAKEPFTFIPAGTHALHEPSPDVRSRWLQVADASFAPCTVLSLDRQTGVTSARPCPGDHAPLPLDAFEGREDRMAVGDRPDAAADGSDR
jgi:hypothetical protein